MCEVEFWEVFYGRYKSVFKVVPWGSPLADYRIGDDKSTVCLPVHVLGYVYTLALRPQTTCAAISTFLDC